jgi:hypothetical protein
MASVGTSLTPPPHLKSRQDFSVGGMSGIGAQATGKQYLWSPRAGGRPPNSRAPVWVLPRGVTPLPCPLYSRKNLLIGIGGHLAVPPLPHHRAYGSRTRRFD